MLLRHFVNPVSIIAVLAMLAYSDANADADAGQRDRYKVVDPHFGEVLFNFYQQHYFTGLTNLGVSGEFGRLSNHSGEAELLRGGMLLSWGQHREAATVFEQFLATSEDPALRDRSHFYLGKVRFQRGYLEEAANEFESIAGILPEDLEAERFNLQAQAYMGLNRYMDAIGLLSAWTGPQAWTTYARYNLGVAFIAMGDLDNGAPLLEQVGQSEAEGDEFLALRDRANLALGFVFLQAGKGQDAKVALQRVRLNGPSSNKALLGVGWASAANNNYRKALAPWMELSERDILDSAVQESLLAVPYAFTKLDAVPQAAEYYVRALDVYNAEITRLDSVISDMDDGRLINKFLAEEITPDGGWNWQLESLPDDAQTRYLYFAIADHHFHEALKSYRDLRQLKNYLAGWNARLSVYSELAENQQGLLEEKLPAATLYEPLGDEPLGIQTRARVLVSESQAQRITSLVPQLTELQAELDMAMQKHARFLGDILRDELGEQRQRLISYRAQAQFSLASVYDRLSAESRQE
jgi:tetratricopeptide (TPR) repeat protein